ncbi:hypothetical protein EJ04DRAFT_545131 [Polyplosphaeria fusca]|uniref:Solute carrier family 40 member n=1 Tax=Polyplosphaeria fusca TaxID=682080 RepID=A0A9P4QPZ5_9PLEO|nr:hypothetical protein EJ04DRAFT_545131 [Polyplosphaeria fusca]
MEIWRGGAHVFLVHAWRVEVRGLRTAVNAERVTGDSMHPASSVLWRLYLSHTLSAWNARMFEFGAVIFLATIFPGTLFYASCYALFRSACAALLSSWIGGLVDRTHRLRTVRHSIIWQRISVAVSCLLLAVLLRNSASQWLTVLCFGVSVGLAGVEKLAFVANTISIERDWLVVVSDSLGMKREDINSSMRRIDLACKLMAPLLISVVDAYSTRVAIWVIFGQNILGVVLEYFAIAQVFSAIPELAVKKMDRSTEIQLQEGDNTVETASIGPEHYDSPVLALLRPWKDYVLNPAFLASFSLSLLHLTVLSFASQMSTYLMTLGFTSVHISLMRLVAVILELSATCAAPLLMARIGAVRSGLWFVNEQLISIVIAVSLYSLVNTSTKFAGATLVIGVTLSRVGLWGFDLSVQYLVQEQAPESSRGSFSACEMALQNFFELISFLITMIWHQPHEFRYAAYVSVGAIGISAACFAGFVRQKRGHLLHGSKCFKREGRVKYTTLPTIEEEELVTLHHERTSL